MPAHPPPTMKQSPCITKKPGFSHPNQPATATQDRGGPRLRRVTPHISSTCYSSHPRSDSPKPLAPLTLAVVEGDGTTRALTWPKSPAQAAAAWGLQTDGEKPLEGRASSGTQLHSRTEGRAHPMAAARVLQELTRSLTGTCRARCGGSSPEKLSLNGRNTNAGEENIKLLCLHHVFF